MIKSDIIKKLAMQLTSFPVKTIKLAVDDLTQAIEDCLTEKGRIEIRGFGVIELHYRKSQPARNPKTGQLVISQGKYIPHFKPGKLLKETLKTQK